MPLGDWRLAGGYDTEDSEGYQSIDQGQQREPSVSAPILRGIGEYISNSRISEGLAQRPICLWTFQTAVAVLADCTCLAAPAPALVAILQLTTSTSLQPERSQKRDKPFNRG